MNYTTYSRPAATLTTTERTDYKQLYEDLETAIPALPIDTPHDEIFLKSLNLATEELQLRLCELHLDGVKTHPLSLWSLQTCLELLRDSYGLCIHTDNEDLYITSNADGTISTHRVDDEDHPNEHIMEKSISWDCPSSEYTVRYLARQHSVSFVLTTDMDALHNSTATAQTQ